MNKSPTACFLTHETYRYGTMFGGRAGEKQYKFEEILPIYKQANEAAESGTFADFMEAFKTFDREGQGFIHAAELRHVLTSLGQSISSSLRSPLFSELVRQLYSIDTETLLIALST